MASEDINSQTIASSEQTEQPASTSQEENKKDNKKDANLTGIQVKKNLSLRIGKLKRVNQRKQQMYSWPQEIKLLKLANYSSCQAEKCECMYWRNAQPILKTLDGVIQLPTINFFEPCKLCIHPLENHIEHLRVQSDEEINRLLGMALDVDNIGLSIKEEVDTVTRNAYYQLYQLLRNCIRSMTKPDFLLGEPPFEKPNIAKVVKNFALYTFSHFPAREWEVIYDIEKMLLLYLNVWDFEAPSARLTINADEASAYKFNYTHWLLFCRVPAFCDSLQRYDTTSVFGKTLLRTEFRSICRQLIMDYECNDERDKIASEKRVLVPTHFSKFLSLLEVEIYSDSSPIWNPEFKRRLPSHIRTVSELKPSKRAKTMENFEKIIFPNEKDNFTTINISPGTKEIQKKRPNAEERPALDSQEESNDGGNNSSSGHRGKKI